MRWDWKRTKPWVLLAGLVVAACAEVAADVGQRAMRAEEVHAHCNE